MYCVGYDKVRREAHERHRSLTLTGCDRVNVALLRIAPVVGADGGPIGRCHGGLSIWRDWTHHGQGLEFHGDVDLIGGVVPAPDLSPLALAPHPRHVNAVRVQLRHPPFRSANQHKLNTSPHTYEYSMCPRRLPTNRPAHSPLTSPAGCRPLRAAACWKCPPTAVLVGVAPMKEEGYTMMFNCFW